MKCVKCGKESKKKDRDVGGGRCTSCYQPFVTEPMEDRLNDMEIKSAEDAVSSHGTFYFSKQQLKYQLQRKLNKRIKACSIGLGISLVAFIVLLVFAIIAHGVFVILTLFSAVSLIATLVFKSKLKNYITKLPALVDKWVSINPNEKLLTPEKYQASLANANNDNLDDISFERVLICDRNETVDFFLSNLFHFHYSCPVLGGTGYPQGIYEDMLRRLKQNPNLKVFLLHDYSPAGYAFVRKIKTDPKWFGGKQRYTVVDLGLNVGQKNLFKSMTVKQADRNKKVKETAEVSVFPPAALVALCGAAINEGVPLDLVKTAAAAAVSSGDGYG